MKLDNRYTQKIFTAIDALVSEDKDKIDDTLSNRLIDTYIGFKDFESPIFMDSPFKWTKLTGKALKNLNDEESFSLQIPRTDKYFLVRLKEDVHFQVVRINDKFIFSVFKEESLTCIFEFFGETINGILKEDWVSYDHIHFIIFIFFLTYKIKTQK